jgi:hypothetical protein
MRDRNLDLNTSGDLPESSESLEGGTNGAAAPLRTLRKGFTPVNEDADPEKSYRVDDGGTNSVGDPIDRGGFLKRPQGWER